MKTKCNLCQEIKPLQKNCHVIPEFLYRDNRLFHSNHNLVKLNLAEFITNRHKKIVSHKQKSGEYDKYTLCPDCDKKIIGAYESYAREFLYAKKLPYSIQPIYSDKGKYLLVENVDYLKLKLFYLSILWRASISSRETFSEIKLGESIQDDIRKMILLGEAKSEKTYPIFLMSSLYDRKITKDYLIQPIPLKIAKEDAFIFPIGGILLFISLSMDSFPEELQNIILKENSTIKILKIPTNETWDLISHIYKTTP